MKHRVCINVADAAGQRQSVLVSRKIRLPTRLLRWLFGEFTEVLVLAPSASVKVVSIHAISLGGAQ